MQSMPAQKIKLQSSRSFRRTQNISQTRFDSLLQTKLAENTKLTESL